MKVIEESITPNLSQDLADILSLFTPQKSTVTESSKKPRKASRFRVKWHVDIFIDGQSVYFGSINDASTQGVSLYLNSHLPRIKCTLHIHIPPHNIGSKPHVMAASGKIVYIVYDSNKQSFRIGVNFLSFNLESDLKYLDERLTKHHLKIPEFVA